MYNYLVSVHNVKRKTFSGNEFSRLTRKNSTNTDFSPNFINNSQRFVNKPVNNGCFSKSKHNLPFCFVQTACFLSCFNDQPNCGSGLSFSRTNPVITLKLYAKTLQITFA